MAQSLFLLVGGGGFTVYTHPVLRFAEFSALNLIDFGHHMWLSSTTTNSLNFQSPMNRKNNLQAKEYTKIDRQTRWLLKNGPKLLFKKKKRKN